MPKTSGASFSPLALRRLLSAPDRASGRPRALASLGQAAVWSALAGHTGPVFFLGAEPIAIRALARCDDDVYSLYLRGHAAEARWLTLRSVTVDFGDALFRHFDQVAHE